jgi:serine/threonine protein kinase
MEDEKVEALVAEATDEFLDCIEGGERPDVEEFARRYPSIAAILRQLLPALHAAKQSASSSNGGRAVAPPVAELGVLGDFRLVREIGRGGMGVVYEAEQISLVRRVALKVLPMAAALDPRQLQRFRLEAQAAAHLHHSHIVPIHSVGCEQGVYYYAMQFIEGRSLDEVIAQLRGQARAASDSTMVPKNGAASAPRVDTLPQARGDELTAQSFKNPSYFLTVASLGVQIAEALEYAHGMGVVHRDIKPANLLLDVQGNVYIADFGLAQLRDTPGLTMTGDLVGTLRYMSPEQTRAQRGILDHRTDIYSLGATLYELVALKPAFDASDRAALLYQIAEQDPVRLRWRNSAVPVDLETIVLKAMAKEPERRYGTAKEMADDLRRFLEHRPVQARRPTLVERTAKWARRHRTVVAASLALLLLTAIGLGVSTALIGHAWKTKAHALNQLAQEQKHTEEALQAEAAQRKRAETSLTKAREMVDYFTDVSEEDLADKPELHLLRRKILEAALAYYQNIIDQSQDDPTLREELAASQMKVAAILDQIGSRAEALAALERARQQQEKLAGKSASPEQQRNLWYIYNRLSQLKGGRELSLLTQQAVQADLQLTGDQMLQVLHLSTKRRDAFRDFRQMKQDVWPARFAELSDQEQAINELLQPDQATRLQQIAVQQRGTAAFNDPDIAKALGLTQEQKEKIRTAHENARWATWGDFIPGDFKPEDRNKFEESWHKKFQETWRKAREEIMGVLTAEQVAKWKDMTGKPFEGPRHHRGGPRFGPGPGGPSRKPGP